MLRFHPVPSKSELEQEEEQASSVFQLPPRVLWPLGAVAFCSSIGEGAMAYPRAVLPAGMPDT